MMRVILLFTLACLICSVSVGSAFAAKPPSRAGEPELAGTGNDRVQCPQDSSSDCISGYFSRCVTLLIEHIVIARTPTPFFVLIDSEKGDIYEPKLNPPPHDGRMRRFVDLDEDPWEEQK